MMNERMEIYGSMTSYIELKEIDEAKDFIKDTLGFEPPEANLDRIIVKIYVRPEELSTFEDDFGNKKTIYLPAVLTADDKFKNASALVVSIGKYAYKNPKYDECGPECRVGDWVFIPRHAGEQMSYKNVPFHIITSKDILMVMQGPEWAEKAETYYVGQSFADYSTKVNDNMIILPR